MSSVKWNNDISLILSDLDETVADLYLPADPRMVEQLISLLEENKVIFLITGQGLNSVLRRVVHFIPQPLRKNILISPCSGVEVWGHDNQGNLTDQPFYSLYEQQLSKVQKQTWREIVQQIITEFKLQVVDTMPVSTFKEIYGSNPLTVMFEDRGSQITFEVVNGHNVQPEQVCELQKRIPGINIVSDLRIPIIEKAERLLQESNIPISARIAGIFAVDFVVEGVSKTTAIQHVLSNADLLDTLGLNLKTVNDPTRLEIWGDKFSKIRGGSDRYMSLAVSPSVRSIDFREEEVNEFEEGYNIVIWDGEKHLHEGLLEYLQSR